jgi:drug/metabolite transporter (DMT)-like permease
MREFLVLTLLVVSGTSGELCITHAMKSLGEMHDFRPAALLHFVWRAVRVGWVWLGVSLMAVAFFSLLAMLSFENVSFVVPVTAISYAAGAVGARVFLRERINVQRWVGVAIVCLGVTIVWLSHR